MSGALEAALKRDRFIVWAALAAVTLLAWVYLSWLAGDMSSSTDMAVGHAMPDMPGMDMSGMGRAAISPRVGPWSAAEFVLTVAMWAVMMVGMMTPSAAPMILIYARVGRQAAEQGKPLAATGWFAGGYFASWGLFSLVAATAQAAVDQVAGLTPAMALASGRVSAAVLIAAGIYQWTPLKDACLRRCRAPLAFIQRHGGFKRHAWGSLDLGLRHGLYCIGCCWALMTLLFVGGVMNLAWIAAIAAFVIAEKLTSRGHVVARLGGLGLVASGAWLLFRAT